MGAPWFLMTTSPVNPFCHELTTRCVTWHEPPPGVVVGVVGVVGVVVVGPAVVVVLAGGVQTPAAARS
jgi:hypothetical protein